VISNYKLDVIVLVMWSIVVFLLLTFGIKKNQIV
jgi:hypothetical protein